MKELSIEEKAKRYDEALKVLHKYDGANIMFSQDLKEEMFPELKESEDERIRKEIMSYIKSSGAVTNKRWIAWLEKQYTDPIKEYWRGYNEGKQNVLDKYAKLEKQGEAVQSVDKVVEPKFKVGDWLVHNERKNIIKIINHTPFTYEVVNILGYHHTIISDAIKNNYHLWTIQDAKDGDVLVSGEQLFLFKRMNTSNSFYAHCNYHFIGYDSLSVYDCSYSIDNIYPATKEQRDTLFAKMKEAGYVWDDIKKELKKIEHKHICKLDNSRACVKFPFKAKVKSSGKIVTIYDGQLSQGGKEWIKYQSDVEDGYKVYEPNNLELVCGIEQNSDWSEENERTYKSVLYAFEHNYPLNSEQQKFIKSLKDRVQPKQD